MGKKCPVPACGFECDGELCSKCGTSKIEKKETSESVVCDGKTDDGQPCGKLLTAEHEYCSNCGYKVKVDVKECRDCGTNVSPDDKFCCRCGVNLELAVTKGN